MVHLTPEAIAPNAHANRVLPSLAALAPPSAATEVDVSPSQTSRIPTFSSLVEQVHAFATRMHLVPIVNFNLFLALRMTAMALVSAIDLRESAPATLVMVDLHHTPTAVNAWTLISDMRATVSRFWAAPVNASPLPITVNATR